MRSKDQTVALFLLRIHVLSLILLPDTDIILEFSESLHKCRQLRITRKAKFEHFPN